MSRTDIQILGGGPAGLIAGYFARQAGISFHIYESSPVVGGNCRTLRHGDFMFDSGAHRFHDKDETATRVVRSLLGEELRSVQAPSQIYSAGRFINFPLAAGDLVRNVIRDELVNGEFRGQTGHWRDVAEESVSGH